MTAMNRIRLLVLLALLPVGAALAQYMTGQGGHALDGSLQMNSGGYNRSVRSGAGMGRSRYAAGTTRAVYRTNRHGNRGYNPRAAFAPKTRYAPTGYPRGGRQHTGGNRLRYRGQM